MIMILCLYQFYRIKKIRDKIISMKKEDITLARFISSLREKHYLSQKNLAESANVDIATIENVESGQDLFLSTSIRQKIAKALKIDPVKIKVYEKQPRNPHEVSLDQIEEIKLKILEGNLQGNICPVCESKLICRVAEMYDLEDKLVKHPKARCSKCPFQIK